jgi:hypothetical protein
MSRIRVVVALLFLASVVSHGQTTTRLTKPDFEYAPEFSGIAGVRELSDGRVIVVDRKEKKVLMLDANGGESPIGREGSGPGEYLRLGSLVALPADTTLIEDNGNSRYLVVAPSGKPAGVLPLVTLRPQEGVTYGLSPRGVDAQGRLYFAMPNALSSERVQLLRLDRRRDRFDTVASIRNERFGTQRGQPQLRAGGASFGMVVSGPWPVKDEWVATSDGWIAVAHNEPYAVEWTSPAGVTTRGQPIAYAPVKVTEVERQRWREQQSANAGTLTTRDASGKEEVRKIPVPEPEKWPEQMPAFSGTGSVIAAPTGTVWIRRLGPAGARTLTYDVVDRKGAVIERVEIPADHSVVAFGRGMVYVVRTDEDGLQHLQRYRRP